MKTTSLSIKVRGLEVLGILCAGNPSTNSAGNVPNSAILDKYTVQEKVFPLLKGIKTKEPAVVMAALNVFKEVGRITDSDFLATEILPILWSFSLGPLLNLEQFQAFMALIKFLSSRIEQEQTRKLRELSSNTTNGSDNIRASDLMSMPSNDSFGTTGVGEDDFARLVLGKGGAPRPQTQRSQTTNSLSPNWPASPASSMASALHPQQAPSSRAITPDHSLGGFTTLQPSSPNNISHTTTSPHAWNGMQPVQPIQPAGVISNPWMSPPRSDRGLSNTWSSPPPTGNAVSWANLQAPRNGVPNLSSMMSTSQPAPQLNSFGIPPPPSAAGVGAAKTGLDKYESLI